MFRRLTLSLSSPPQNSKLCKYPTAENMDSNQNNPPSSSSKSCVSAFSGFLLAALLGLIVQIFFFSPIDPDLLELPPSLASSSSSSTINNRIQNVIKVGEGIIYDPEDICVDREGIFYTANRDGWVRRMHRNGYWENWKKIDSHTSIGITTTREGGIVVCDGEQGLLKVTEDGVTVLLSHVNGSKLRFADDAIEASDGSLYFSIASTKFGIHNVYLDLLEAKPHGQLLKYNPLSNETTIVLDNLFFANGVALSKDEDYLVVCETWKYRCLRYWLKGENRGKTEIFIENLPGGPDNINLAPDGSFWVAVLQLTVDGLEFVHTSKVCKHLVASFPRLFNLVNGMETKAMVVNVASDGKIIRKFDDSNGKVMNFVTSAIEFEDYLYLAGLNSNFIGKLPLENAY